MNENLSADLASLRIDRSGPPPSRGWLKWLIALGLVAGLTLAGLALKPQLEAQIFKTSVELTQVSVVSPAQSLVLLTATGYVQADRSSKVAPKVAGRVEKVYVSQGQRVAEGDVLVELDPSDDEAAIKAAQRQVAASFAQAKSAQARAVTAKAELAQVRQQAERERRLANEGVSASGVAEDLEAQVQALEKNVNAMEAAAKAAQAEAGALTAQVDVLKTGLNNLTLVAPITGTVVNQPPQLGEFIGPQPAGIAVDMGGISIADFSTLLVETDVPEARLHLVKPGAPTEIVLDAFPDKRYRGKVKIITPEVDRAKATVVVKVDFVDDPEGALPDMAARVSFLSEELSEKAAAAKPKTVVPSGAVTERAGAKVVFVADGDKVRMVPVKLGPAVGSGFELLGGPSPGTKLVANPPATLADGQRIKEDTDA